MLAVLGLLIAANNSYPPIVVDGELCHPRNLMVKYANQSALTSLKRTGSVLRVFPEISYAVVQAKPGYLQLARQQLKAWPGVEHVEYDRCAKPAYDPNDEFWPNQWDMRAIKANTAWDTLKGNPSVVVAVIDTGVFTDHPDLAANIWVNSGEIPGNNIDDDNNGYIDDVNGYDFSNNDSVPNDVYGHGTACAGLVAAVQDNLVGVSGVAPGCKVMALKASTDDGYFYDSNDVAAYLYAAHNGARVLSMSFFSDRVSQSERDAIDYCWNHNVLPVAAAGNAASVYPYYPGAYENTLSVAAVDGNLNKAGFSNYGTWVDVSAPGTGLYTTTNNGSYTSGFGGTSGACPHVAGLAALCFSIAPNLTNAQVRAAIEDTATLQSEQPYGEFSNYGLVNAAAAVQNLTFGGGTTPHPPIVRYATDYVQNGSRSTKKIGRIYGRGFGDGNTVQITTSGSPISIVRKTRDYVDYVASAASSGIDVSVNGNSVSSLAFPGTGTYSFLLAEASTQGATLTGGFREALAADAQYVGCTLRSDNSILVQATFRKVIPTATMHLVLRRQYLGTTVGTETVQLYDWTSASYPYGSFVTVGSGAVPTTMTTSSFTVPNASRFVDPEGTVYLLITTSGDLSNGTTFRLDMAQLNQ